MQDGRWGKGKKRRKLLLNSHRVSVQENKIVLEIDGGCITFLK